MDDWTEHDCMVRDLNPTPTTACFGAVLRYGAREPFREPPFDLAHVGTGQPRRGCRPGYVRRLASRQAA